MPRSLTSPALIGILPETVQSHPVEKLNPWPPENIHNASEIITLFDILKIAHSNENDSFALISGNRIFTIASFRLFPLYISEGRLRTRSPEAVNNPDARRRDKSFPALRRVISVPGVSQSFLDSSLGCSLPQKIFWIMMAGGR